MERYNPSTPRPMETPSDFYVFDKAAGFYPTVSRHFLPPSSTVVAFSALLLHQRTIPRRHLFVNLRHIIGLPLAGPGRASEFINFKVDLFPFVKMAPEGGAYLMCSRNDLYEFVTDLIKILHQPLGVHGEPLALFGRAPR